MPKEKKSRARKTSALPTRIWSFHARVEDPEARQQALDVLWSAGRYYNTLIAIERRRIERFNAARRVHAPKLAELDAEWQRLDDCIEEIAREVRRERAKYFRQTGEKSLHIEDEQKDAIAALKTEKTRVSALAKPLREAFSDLLMPDRDEHKRRSAERALELQPPASREAGIPPGPPTRGRANEEVLREMLSEWLTRHPAWCDITESDFEALRELKAARAACGLMSGTYQQVEAAVVRAKEDRAPRPPKFKSNRGTGKLAVQFTGRVTFEDVCIGRSTKLRLTPDPKPGRKGRSEEHYRVELRVGSNADRSPIFLTFNARLHRRPPLDAQVKWAWLVVRHQGERRVCELQLTLEHASFSLPKRPPGVGDGGHVRIGWATTKRGVRVALWPTGDLVVPHEMLLRADRSDRLKGHADDHFESVKRLCKRWLALGPNRITHWERIIGDRKRFEVRKVCQAFAELHFGDALKSLWRTWVESKPRDLFPTLTQADRWIRVRGYHEQASRLAWWLYLWLRKDQHLRQWSADARVRFENARDALFRDTAIRLSTQFETVTVDDYDIAELKKHPMPLTLPGEAVNKTSQHNAQYAAPGRFRELLREVMGSRATPCERPGVPGSPRTARKLRNDKRNSASDDTSRGTDRFVDAAE